MSPSNQTIHYRIRWRPRSIRPGQHRGQMHGMGQLFKSHLPLLAHPDPQRLDIRASLLDVFAGYWVRSYYQRSPIPAVVIADLSRSMSFNGRHCKHQVLTDFTALLANSVYQGGDAFSFIGCDQQVRPELFLPASYRRGLSDYLHRTLTHFVPNKPSAEGLGQCQAWLPNKRSLVFLISDFHLPDALLLDSLHSLSHHDVVPVILWDTAEYSDLPEWGLVRLQDLESGHYRTLMLRPQLKQAILQRYHNRLQQLVRLFLTQGREPLVLQMGAHADQATTYFYHSG